MRITELFHGFGQGGAEVASLTRSRYAPSHVKTTLVVAGEIDADFIRSRGPLSGQLSLMRSTTRLSDKVAAINASNPDVLVLNTPRDCITLLTGARRKIRAPIAIAAHNEVLSDRLALSTPLSLAMRWVNRRADLHLAVSNRVAQGPWCTGSRSVVVCPLGAELSRDLDLDEVSWPTGTHLRLLTISRLTQPKNLEALIQAVGMKSNVMRNRGAHLRVVGDGPEGHRLKTVIEELNVPDLVSMAGPANGSTGWLLNADWLLIPSLAEGGPLTLFEGLQVGLPVMATARGAVPEALDGDTESVLIEQTDTKALAEGLAQVLSRPTQSVEERSIRAIRESRWSSQECSRAWYTALSGLVARFGDPG